MDETIVMGGFHAPHVLDVIKLIRTAPVFLVALIFLPFAFARRKRDRIARKLVMSLGGRFFDGLGDLFLTMTLIAPDYVRYVVYAQIILAAGLLALAAKLFPEEKSPILILVCVILVSIRAVGMTTWGAACAWKNSYWQTQRLCRRN